MEVVTILAKSNRVSYRIELKSKFTFIRGNSGVGKTVFINMFREDLYTIDRNYIIYELPHEEKFAYNIMLDNAKDSKAVFVADEDYSYMHHLSFQLLMQQSEGLFLIVYRNPFSCLSYSTSDILQLDNTKEHNVKPAYEYTLQNIDFNLVKQVVVEDSESGFKFFSRIYSNVKSSKGKDNILNLMEKENNTLFIMDALGGGSTIKSIDDYLTNNTDCNNQLLLIDSFEAMVLQSEFLRAWADPPINCVNKEMYATELLIKVLKEFGITYTKTSSNKCLTDDCCHRDLHCPCRKYGNKLQLIAGELYNGLKTISTKTDNDICLEIIKLPDTEAQAILQAASQFSDSFRSAHASIDFNNPLSIQMHCQMLTSL